MALKILSQNLFKDFLLKNVRRAPIFSNLHTSAALAKEGDRREMMKSFIPRDEGTRGEGTVDIDSLIAQDAKFRLFPDITLPDRIFNGIPFKELPICNIRVSRNNTIVSYSDYKGRVILINSCGIEGFKNCRKGTNIAAQATAISVSDKALKKGWDTVRVVVQGLGPGRLAAIKGVQMAGINVVSITDATRVSDNPPRPRKVRRI